MARGDGAPQDGEVTSTSSARRRVLIVDDLSEIRLVMRLLLEADGELEVIGEAADGGEAVRMARELQPDAVLLDVRMPDMSGFDVVPLLREVAPRTAVLLLTALPAVEVAERAEALGVGYVRKPEFRRAARLLESMAGAGARGYPV